jgi:hypothetical protein
MSTERPRLAVLGHGAMAGAMAGAARRAGLPLVVWNRRPVAAAHRPTQGVEVAPSVLVRSPLELCGDCGGATTFGAIGPMWSLTL